MKVPYSTPIINTSTVSSNNTSPPLTVEMLKHAEELLSQGSTTKTSEWFKTYQKFHNTPHDADALWQYEGYITEVDKPKLPRKSPHFYPLNSLMSLAADKYVWDDEEEPKEKLEALADLLEYIIPVVKTDGDSLLMLDVKMFIAKGSVESLLNCESIKRAAEQGENLVRVLHNLATLYFSNAPLTKFSLFKEMNPLELHSFINQTKGPKKLESLVNDVLNFLWNRSVRNRQYLRLYKYRKATMANDVWSYKMCNDGNYYTT